MSVDALTAATALAILPDEEAANIFGTGEYTHFAEVHLRQTANGVFDNTNLKLINLIALGLPGTSYPVVAVLEQVLNGSPDVQAVISQIQASNPAITLYVVKRAIVELANQVDLISEDSVTALLAILDAP